jgi:hypothetical protein
MDFIMVLYGIPGAAAFLFSTIVVEIDARVADGLAVATGVTLDCC